MHHHASMSIRSFFYFILKHYFTIPIDPPFQMSTINTEPDCSLQYLQTTHINALGSRRGATPKGKIKSKANKTQTGKEVTINRVN